MQNEEEIKGVVEDLIKDGVCDEEDRKVFTFIVELLTNGLKSVKENNDIDYATWYGNLATNKFFDEDENKVIVDADFDKTPGICLALMALCAKGLINTTEEKKEDEHI